MSVAADDLMLLPQPPTSPPALHPSTHPRTLIATLNACEDEGGCEEGLLVVYLLFSAADVNIAGG